MSSAKWKSAHDRGRKNRPDIGDIKAFLPDAVSPLFEEFSKHLARAYGVHCAPPTYTESAGWVYKFERSGIPLIDRVTIEDSGFSVEGVLVKDAAGLKEALALAERLHAEGYRERYLLETSAKKERQRETTQRRLAREGAELRALSGVIDPARFNKYRWARKITRNALTKLYESDAKGLFDDALLDEIGYALYARCAQGRDERLLIESGKLKCHNCGAILNYAPGLIQCPCGSQYFFRDYMRSFRRENMPSGAATAIFNAFVEAWPKAAGYSEKMRLVDGLIHAFHTNLNSGVQGRFVGVNLIEGTKKQIGDLILTLAYGDSAERFMNDLLKQ